MKAFIIKKFYYLTKPGIIYGNAITATGGFFLGARGHPVIALLLITLVGLSLIIASACVLNNLIDSDIDALMARTKNRALVKGTISKNAAIIYGVVLGIFGSVLLAVFVNFLALLVALAGLFFYVIVYTYSKRHTYHGTLIGCISGAVPPVVGYTAVTNQLDLAALLLFLIMVFWQMPHFYSIAIYRMREYASAKIPVITVVKGVPATKIVIPFLILAFIILSVSLTLFGFAGYIFLIAVLILGLSWLGKAVIGLKNKSDELWARQMFRHSLIVITLLFFAISVDSFFS